MLKSKYDEDGNFHQMPINYTSERTVTRNQLSGEHNTPFLSASLFISGHSRLLVIYSGLSSIWSLPGGTLIHAGSTK